jgi:hypothetical protein
MLSDDAMRRELLHYMHKCDALQQQLTASEARRVSEQATVTEFFIWKKLLFALTANRRNADVGNHCTL